MTIEPRTPTQPDKLKRRSACRAWVLRSAHRAAAPSSPPPPPVLRPRTGPRPAGRSTGRRPVINPTSMLFLRKKAIQHRSARHRTPPPSRQCHHRRVYLSSVVYRPSSHRHPFSTWASLKKGAYNGPVSNISCSVGLDSAGELARTRVGRTCSARATNTGKRAFSPGT